MNLVLEFVKSWSHSDYTTNTNSDIMDWISSRNKEIYVNITQNNLSDSHYWFYDKEDGRIKNKDEKFFSICGLSLYNGDILVQEQPIIIQDEIGFLGIIAKKVDGIIQFLMQAKIEPGNVNKIQLSPTIQATKSNFSKVHKGKSPLYLEYFLAANKYSIIADQIQSEQSSRFYKKRNRNIIIMLSDYDTIEVSANHKWMTLGQIKTFLHYDNIVNMDTRTVISCIPYDNNALSEEIALIFRNKYLYNSIFSRDAIGLNLFHEMNNMKMFEEEKIKLTSLDALTSWDICDKHIRSQKPANFEIIFAEIEIEGREVSKWTQPLFKAASSGLFGLFISVMEDKTKFLVKLKKEIGNFDVLELGPSVQLEPIEINNCVDTIDLLFLEIMSNNPKCMLHDVMLSEEGGRFYHEQNRNVIIQIEENSIKSLPKHYFWLDYAQLNEMVRYNNILNIQLRNLISLLEV